jgi:hypothetical protein
MSEPSCMSLASERAKLSTRETLRLIVQARRAGVTLFIGIDGQLGLRTDRPPAGELLVAFEEQKADILALLPPPRVELAKLMIWRLRAQGFRPCLDGEGALMVVDAYATGKKRRDVSERPPIGEVFDTLVAGLADDPGAARFIMRRRKRK